MKENLKSVFSVDGKKKLSYYESPNIKMDTVQVLYKQWLRSTQKEGVFVHSLNHKCEKCNLRPIPLWRCNGETICMWNPPLLCQQEGSVTLFSCGGEPKCAGSNHMPIPAGEISVHFCVSTGTPHYCGSVYCDKSVINGDGAIVCTATGIVLLERRVTQGKFGDPDIYVSYVPQDTKEFNPTTIREKALDFVGQKYPVLANGVDAFSARATVVVTTLLSPKRFELDQPEAADASAVISKAKRQGVRDFLDLFVVLAHFRDRTNTLSVDFTPEHTSSLTPHYVLIALGLWGVLRKEVPGGKLVAKRSLFNEFVVASMELYREGIIVRDRMNRYDIVLLAVDPILSVIGVSEEAKFLVHGKHSTQKNFSKRASKLRKEIRTLFQEAISRHSVIPELLRIDEASREIFRYANYYN